MTPALIGLSALKEMNIASLTAIARELEVPGATGMRKEELLIPKADLNRVWVLRKVLHPLSATEAMELLLSKMGKTKTNAEFLASMNGGR